VATVATETSLANNTSAATPVTVSVPTPDLAVTKTTTATSVNTGEPISYLVTVTNQGSASAPNVMLTDTPAGATVTSMSPSQGSCTPPTCSLGTIAAGGSVTVAVVLTTSTPGTVSNSATATTTGAESNAGNNTGTARPVTVTTPVTGCTAVGEVHGDGHWKFVDVGGKKRDAHVEVEGNCDLDKKTNTVFLHHAHVKIHVDGEELDVKAKTDDHHNHVATVIIVDGDAIVTGMWNGQPFLVTLRDGGEHNHSTDHGDVMDAQYGAFDTATLTRDHVNVHINDD